MLFVRSLIFQKLVVSASTFLHNGALRKLIHATMTWFESQPTGRILNRFTKDLQDADHNLPLYLEFHFMCASRVLCISILLCIVTPWLLLALLPLGSAYVASCRYYAHTARDCQRLVALSTSPLFAFFSESLDGLDTIRAYQQQDNFVSTFVERLRENCRANSTKIVANCWLDQRLGVVGCFMIGVSSLLLVLGRELINPALAGITMLITMQWYNNYTIVSLR